MKKKREIIIRATKTNPGIRAAYRRRLEREIDAMRRSVDYWVQAAYRHQEQRLPDAFASDASPARDMTAWMTRLRMRWTKRWNSIADRWATSFVDSVFRRVKKGYQAAFKDAGIPLVSMASSRVQQNTVQALIAENTQLIKSIPTQYFGRISSLVNRSMIAGRDTNALAEGIRDIGFSTSKRARLIARDQSDKATQAIRRTEDARLGITEGLWVHMPGAKSSRETHIDMDGKRFKLDTGLYDSEVRDYVLPAELPYCRCVYRSILPVLGE